MKCLIVRPVSTIALMGAAALVLGGCSPNVGSSGVSNGATVAADQIHSRGVHSNDACGVSYTEPITRNGTLKIPMCNAGHYGINTGKLTYGKISHSASVELTAYDANPSTSECKVGAGETAYAWLTVTATHAVTFDLITAHQHVDKSTLFNSGFKHGTYTFWASSTSYGPIQWGGSLGSVPPHTLTFASPLQGQMLPANTLYCFSVAMP
jgi:hypothetical protein